MLEKRIIQTIFIVLILASPGLAQWGSIGNVAKEYPNVGITCYLGHLARGMPTYFCLYADMSMDHSFFPYQYQKMDDYYTGGMTTTFTAHPKK